MSVPWSLGSLTEGTKGRWDRGTEGLMVWGRGDRGTEGLILRIVIEVG